MSLVLEKGTFFCLDDLKKITVPADATAIITPLIGEFPAEMIPKLKEIGFARVALDVQGYTRQLNPKGEVTQANWLEKEKYLPYVDYLKIDNKESKVLFGTDDIRQGSLAAMKLGVAHVVATCADGVLFTQRKAKEALTPAQFGSLTLDDCESEWRPWKLPRTPECRTGRGIYIFIIIIIIYAFFFFI